MWSLQARFRSEFEPPAEEHAPYFRGELAAALLLLLIEQLVHEVGPWVRTSSRRPEVQRGPQEESVCPVIAAIILAELSAKLPEGAAPDFPLVVVVGSLWQLVESHGVLHV